MQALPRINMLYIDLKESTEIPDLSLLENYIEKHYNESSNTYKDAFNELKNLRKGCLTFTENLTSLASMKRYYSQLQLLKARFPMSENQECSIIWTWEDSNTGTVSLNDIRLEEAYILFNIGCLHCNLGQKEPRIELDSTKIACTHFQCAAWAFQTVLESYTPLPSSDMDCDFLRLLNLLMLAQSHECVLEKSMVDQRRSGLVAKIAFQISDLYKQCQGLMKSENIGYSVNSVQYKNWKRTCILKEHVYYSLSYYYMGLLGEESNKYGEIVAWMKLAKEKLDKSLKTVKDMKSKELDETIKFMYDVINGKLESSIKDNDFIYHDKVPESGMLPTIKGAMLLKGLPMDVNDPDICGQDIFKHLVPLETHMSASIYSERKAILLREIQSEIDAKDEEIEKFITSINWDTDNLSITDSKIPQEMYSCAAFVSANPDIINTIKSTMQDISSISIEVEESLELLSNNMRSADMSKNTDTWNSLQKEYSQLVSNFEDGKDSNNQLREAFANTFNDFKLMEQPIEDVISKLPSVTSLELNDEVKSLLAECSRLLDKVNEMKTQRNDLLMQLKSELLSDELTQQLLKSETKEEQEVVIKKGLEKHQTNVEYLRQNMSAQPRIMEAIIEHNAKIADVKSKLNKIKTDRETTVNRVSQSFQTHNSLISKGNEGIEFYQKLGCKVLKLQSQVEELIPKPIKSKHTPNISSNSKSTNMVVPKSKSIDSIPTDMGKLKPSINQLNSEVPDVIPSQSTDSYKPTISTKNYTPKLKDYFSDGKYKDKVVVSDTPTIPTNERVSQSVHNPHVGNIPNNANFPYNWGYYGPSNQAVFNPYYSISKTKQPSDDFRTTQNFDFVVPCSEINQSPNYSAYANFSSLPRHSVSHHYSNMNTNTINSPSNSNGQQYTIPYQQQFSYYSTNTYSMAHSHFKQPSSTPQVSQAKTTLLPSSQLQDPNMQNYYYQHQNLPQSSSNTMPISSHLPYINSCTPRNNQPQYFSNSSPLFNSLDQSHTQLSQLPEQTPYVGQPQQSNYITQQTPMNFYTQVTQNPQQLPIYNTQHPQQQTNCNTPQVGQNPQLTPNYNTQQISQNTQHQQTNYNTSQVGQNAQQAHNNNTQQMSQNTQHQQMNYNTPQVGQNQQQANYSTPHQLTNFNNTQQLPINYNPQHSTNYTIATQQSDYNSHHQSTNYNIQQSHTNNNTQSQESNYNPQNTSYRMPSQALEHPQYNLQNNTNFVSQSQSNNATNSKLSTSQQHFLSSSPITPSKFNSQTHSPNHLRNINLSSNKIATPQSTDLLSSSPVSTNQPSAVLEPKKLTKEEIEDQKEEERRQIYRKSSGSMHNSVFNDNLVLNKFISDAEKCLKKTNDLNDVSNKSLDTIWTQLLTKERSIPKKSSAIAKCCPLKNRSQDIVPYDENRVIIKEGKDDYINASHITLQNVNDCLPRFITFQSPLITTLSEFWTAIFEQGCEILVQLATISDKQDDVSKTRVISYWPDSKVSSLNVGCKFDISVQSFKEKHGWDERILLIKHIKTNQSRSVWHFQLHNMTNKFPKSNEDFLAFSMELCSYYRQQRSLNKPIGISCCNGSSASGLLVLLISAMTLVEITGVFPDIEQILLEMWSQRKNLLDDKHQLVCVYKMITKACCDILSKRNVVIGPGRKNATIPVTQDSSIGHHYHHHHTLSGSITSLTSQSSSIASPAGQIQHSQQSIFDSIFSNKNLQINELNSAISKWTVKEGDDMADCTIVDSSQLDNKNNSSKSSVSELESVNSFSKVPTTSASSSSKNNTVINLSGKLEYLQNPENIDFTPTPVEKRKFSKKEFEMKMQLQQKQQHKFDPAIYDNLSSLK